MTNRRNERRRLFFQDADYQAFLHLLARGKEHYPVKVYGVCLMPNHIHALIQPDQDGALSSYLQWVLGRYACDLRSLTRTVGYGHVFQGRFWSDVIESEFRFLSVLRYIEANAFQASLVRRAEEWRWSSISLRQRPGNLLDRLPLDLPRNWIELVNTRQPAEEVEAIQSPKRRGRPVRATSTRPDDKKK